jgi:hypothetical protein
MPVMRFAFCLALAQLDAGGRIDMRTYNDRTGFSGLRRRIVDNS